LDKDLEGWVPRLIAVWRKASQSAGKPEERLTSAELRQVAAGVRRLSLGLTRDRSFAGAKYMDDPLLLGAYLLFYWLISYAQARAVLGELRTRPRRVLDLGSGPGPFAFAALDHGASEVTAADRSKKALALARELAIEADEGLFTREWDLKPHQGSVLAGRLGSDDKFDVIGLGHLLNELFGSDERTLERRADLLEEALGKLKPGGSVVVIEPALRETSRNLLAVRDLIVARGYAVRAPCFYRGNCPALVKESDWCHAEHSWQPPRLVEEIARAAGLHKESLKMSYLVLAPKGESWREPPAGRVFRIVSESLEGKGRQRYIGCGPEGRLGLALQAKHRTEANAAFFELHRGDVVRVTEPEPRGDGLALSDRSEVKVLARAGQPTPDP
jgi:SAM-dependent methyltransferase